MKIKLNEQDIRTLVETVLNEYHWWDKPTVEPYNLEKVKKEIETDRKNRLANSNSKSKEEKFEIMQKQADMVKKAIALKKQKEADKEAEAANKIIRAKQDNDDLLVYNKNLIQKEREEVNSERKENYNDILESMTQLVSEIGSMSKAYDVLFKDIEKKYKPKTRQLIKNDFFRNIKRSDYTTLYNIENSKKQPKEPKEPQEYKTRKPTEKTRGSNQDLGNFNPSRQLKNSGAYSSGPEDYRY